MTINRLGGDGGGGDAVIFFSVFVQAETAVCDMPTGTEAPNGKSGSATTSQPPSSELSGAGVSVVFLLGLSRGKRSTGNLLVTHDSQCPVMDMYH